MALPIHPTAQVIWKFPLPHEHNAVVMPRGAQVLMVAAQDGQPTLWAAVCPDNAFETRTFVVVGTGKDLPDNRDRAYLGGVLLVDGRVVLHVLELDAVVHEPTPGNHASNVNGEVMQIGSITGGIYRQ